MPYSHKGETESMRIEFHEQAAARFEELAQDILAKSALLAELNHLHLDQARSIQSQVSLRKT